MRSAFSCALLTVIVLLGGCQIKNRIATDMKAELVAVDDPRRAILGNSIRSVSHRDAVAAEIRLVESLLTSRNQYKATLRKLEEHYATTGDGTKGEWVRTELGDFATMRKYRYLAEAEVAGPSLTASVAIDAANTLYDEAFHLKKSFALLGIGKGEKLRVAVEKFNRIIREHPTSDKIDDAAYHAGEIYASRHFKDYWRAVLYFQRCFQWDPATPWPARLRAAEVLDYNLLERRTAMKLYNEALTKSQSERARRRAHDRIKQLSREP